MSGRSAVSILLLGPVSVRAPDGRELLPAGPRVQGLLARLALDAGRLVDTGTLVDALWGDDPPSTANALQSLVSRLRRVLGPERVRAAAGGYVLDVDPDDVDALRFAALRRAAAAEPDAPRACALLTEALRLWREPVLGGVRELPFAGAAAARLTDTRAAAAEELAARGLAAGTPDAGRETLTAILDEHPLRETTAVALARGLHAGGRRADALAVLDRTRAALAEELGVDPGPDLRRARTELLQDAPAPPSSPPPSSPPPATPPRPRPLTSFVGRDDDLARVRELTRTSRLVTVTGPGGAGKTRLTLEAVRDLGTPVAVAELAALTGAVQVAPEVLHAVGGPQLVLGDRADLDAHDVLARLRAALAGRELVLLLDNCEHLVDAAAQLVHDLLTTVPGLVVLATSREPLGVPGEVLHPLGALDEAHAARLFTERAAAVRPGFVPDGHREVIGDICRRLDGQPLPIELAAARVRSLEPAEIAERLADRFRLLTTGARTALPRHQTLRAVVDWSWDLLSDDERTLAARCGVFAGAVDAPFLEAVCGEGTFELLGALVEKSLVVAVPDSGPVGGPTRYRMLETIREYAAERLAESGEWEAVVDTHADRVLAVLEPAEPRLRGEAQLDALAVVRAVEGEAVRALERAADGPDGPDGADGPDTARAHRLLAVLTWSWLLRGDMTALLRWSGRVAGLDAPSPTMAVAVNRAVRAALSAVAPEVSEATETPETPETPENAENAENAETVEIADVPRFRAETAAVVAMAQGLPRPWHPIVALLGPAVRAFADGDRSELVDLARDADDPWLRAAAAQVVSMHAENLGEPEVRRRFLRTAHEDFARLGDRLGLGLTTFALGEVEDVAGDRAAARAAYLEAISLAEQLRKFDDLPQYRIALAQLAARDGDAPEARRQIGLARDAAAGSPEPWALAWLVWGRADVERRLGDPERALALLSEPVPPADIEPGPGREQREALLHHLTAAALTDLGRLADAREELDAATRSATESDDGPVLGQVAEACARWALASGDPERAGELLGVALARRGTLYLGDPEVVATRDAVRADLGPAAADAAVDRGRAGGSETLIAQVRRR